jgi:hypothetical protein
MGTHRTKVLMLTLRPVWTTNLHPSLGPTEQHWTFKAKDEAVVFEDVAVKDVHITSDKHFLVVTVTPHIPPENAYAITSKDGSKFSRLLLECYLDTDMNTQTGISSDRLISSPATPIKGIDYKIQLEMGYHYRDKTTGEEDKGINTELNTNDSIGKRIEFTELEAGEESLTTVMKKSIQLLIPYKKLNIQPGRDVQVFFRAKTLDTFPNKTYSDLRIISLH